ncbi:MAG TPA: hypothetical protein VLH18_07290 [Candidatus Limnocylindrales bacterium]|nr:hypothetical protein [Candidatus Limnocylindrales bacterium]
MARDIYEEEKWRQEQDRDRQYVPANKNSREDATVQAGQPEHDNETEEEVLLTDSRSGSGHSGGSGSRPGLKSYVLFVALAALVVLGLNNYIFGRPISNAGAFGGRVGGCSGCAAPAAAVAGENENPNEVLRQFGLAYYAERYNDTDVEATVQDFGCHQEIRITKDGQLVLLLSHVSGQIYEIEIRR